MQYCFGDYDGTIYYDVKTGELDGKKGKMALYAKGVTEYDEPFC